MAAMISLASLFGSYAQAQGIKNSGANEARAYQSRAFAADMDAADLETQAMLERENTILEAQRYRRAINQTRGTQRAAVAASGVELSGSAAQVLSESAEEQEFDALMLRFNGMSRQLSKQRGATMSRLNAQTLRAEGALAKSNAKSAARNTLLTGAVNTLSMFNKLGSI